MKGHLLRLSVAVVMICSALSTSARAQSAKIFFVDNYGYPTCAPVSPGFHQIYLQFAAVGPLATARFKVQASSPVTIFSPPNGEFDLTFPGAAPVLVCVVPPGPAVTLSVVPATGHGAIEVTDRDGYDMSAVWEGCIYQLLGPYRPNPPDGATDVPTNQLLSYVGDANYVALSTNPNMDIWDPANVIICNNIETGTTGPPCSLPLNPGSLAPHTTYYWQAAYYCACGQVYAGYSEVFSFTTGDGPLAVDSTTWGRVKALYRE